MKTSSPPERTGALGRKNFGMKTKRAFLAQLAERALRKGEVLSSILRGGKSHPFFCPLRAKKERGRGEERARGPRTRKQRSGREKLAKKGRRRNSLFFFSFPLSSFLFLFFFVLSNARSVSFFTFLLIFCVGTLRQKTVSNASFAIAGDEGEWTRTRKKNTSRDEWGRHRLGVTHRCPSRRLQQSVSFPIIEKKERFSSIFTIQNFETAKRVNLEKRAT